MIMNKNDIIEYLQKNQSYFHNTFGIKFIGLFGSFSRGDQTTQSDIDILYDIENNKKLSIFKYLQIIKQLEDYFHTKIDLVRQDTLKPTVKKYIEQDIVYV